MEIAKNKKSRKSESHFCRVLLARKFFMIERLVVMNLDEIKRKLIADVCLLSMLREVHLKTRKRKMVSYLLVI